MTHLLVWALTTWGLTSILTRSQLLRPLRDRLSPSTVLGSLARCDQCMGLWVGLGLSLWPGLGMARDALPGSSPWVWALSDGVASSALCAAVGALTDGVKTFAARMATGWEVVEPEAVEPRSAVRRFPLSFAPGSVPAHMESRFVNHPSVAFRGDRLVVPSSIASAFDIMDIWVGGRSQRQGLAPLSARMFDETAVGVRLSMEWAAKGEEITLVVKNITDSSAQFQAVLIGEIDDPSDHDTHGSDFQDRRARRWSRDDRDDHDLDA